MRRLGRIALAVFVTLALVGLFGLTMTRFVVTNRSWPTMAAAFASYAVLGFVVTLAISLLLLRGAQHRGWVLAAVVASAVGVAAHVYWLSPLYVGGGGRADLVVMSANLEFGHGDAATVVRTATSHHVDVLVLQEVTPEENTALARAGLAKLLPHHAGQPAHGAKGTMVFSRFAVDEILPLTLGNGGLDVRVATIVPFRLLAVHTEQPVKGPVGWRRDLGVLRERARAAVHEGPTLAVGDFNATQDHALFRRVLGEGMYDAAEEAGSGWQTTWPSKWRGTSPRPLIALDHVLTSNGFTAVRTSTVEVPHTDHLALVVEVRTGSDD